MKNLIDKYKETTTNGKLFKLSSGGESLIYYDFRKLLLKENRRDLFEIACIFLDYMDDKYHNNPIVVGIHKMGGIIAKFYFPDGIDRFCVYIPLTNTFLINPRFKTIIKDSDNNYILIDDVITTGTTISKTIRNINKNPLEILCLKNRSMLSDINGIKIHQLL